MRYLYIIIYFLSILYLLRKVKSTRKMLLALMIVTIPLQGGLWISFLRIDFRLIYIFVLMSIVYVKPKQSNARLTNKFYLKIAVPAIGLFICSLISLINVFDYGIALGASFELLIDIIFLYIILNFVKTPDDALYAIKWLSISLLFEAAVAITQFRYNNYFTIPFFGTYKPTGIMTWRSTGTLIHPNQMGMYSMLVLPIMLRMIIYNIRNKITKELYWYCFVFMLGGVALFSTYNRGSWVGLTLGLLMMLFFELFQRGKKRTKRILMGLMTVGLILFGVFILKYGDVIYERLFASDIEHISTERNDLAAASIPIIKANPLGVGLWNYEYHVNTIFVHNMYLLLTAELGWLGGAFFLWFILASLAQILSGRRSHILFVSNFSQGLFATFLGLLVASVPGPDYLNSHMVRMHYIFLIGLMLSMNRFDLLYKKAKRKEMLEQKKYDVL